MSQIILVAGLLVLVEGIWDDDSAFQLECATLTVGSLWSRFYTDFLMRSRLGAYRDLLRDLLTHGYEICSAECFWEMLKHGQVSRDKKYVVLRHDIDSDVPGARLMWQIDQSLGVKSSYYFRLSTIDVPLMQEITDCGGDASYHYEELATIAKELNLKTRAEVLLRIPEMQRRFRSNLVALRERTGLPMKVVASHGDFVNRKLGICNWEILKDDNLRRELDIEMEIFDDAFQCHFSRRYADSKNQHDPWKPENPLKKLTTSSPTAIQILVHPGNWRAHRSENFRLDFQRGAEGLRFWL